MQKKSISTSAFFNLRALIGLLVCAATAYFILIPIRTGLAFLHASSNASQRTLTFEERVSYQRAIEDVYWRHRIWPKERPDRKPSLDAVMSQAQLDKNVADYLRKSQALEDYWQRPITAEQLQAEMDRMAQHTREPEVLQELFEALGNDPLVIAECLARPALAERLLTSWYAYDERIHGELKQRAESELQARAAVEQMTQTSTKYGEIEFVKTDGADTSDHRDAKHSVKVNNRQWDQTVQKLAATFDKPASNLIIGRDGLPGRPSHSARPAVERCQTLPVGKLSSLQQDETHFYAMAILNKTSDRLKVATVSWLKEPIEGWLARAENQVANTLLTTSGTYKLPAISGGGCIDDTWAPPPLRESFTRRCGRGVR